MTAKPERTRRNNTTLQNATHAQVASGRPDAAEQVDMEYQEYVASLPKKTAAIRAGQKAWEQYVS